MLTTKEKILKASLKVFSQKGFIEATTLEISKEAGLSEMTLFRHFKTKKNLFLTTIEQTIGKAINKEQELNLETNINDFIYSLLKEKFYVISENITIIKMLIRESLSNLLTDDLDFPKIIYQQVVKKVELYIKHHSLSIDSNSLSEILVGILLRYAVMEENNVYCSLKDEEKKEYIKKYIDVFNYKF